MSLLEKFNNTPPGANATFFLRDMAAALDGIAANIKAMPSYNPATAPVMMPADVGNWKKAIETANGWGDILNRLRGMAETIDNINTWIDAQGDETRLFGVPAQAIGESSTPRRGRPPKASAA